jgi:hypothetical protein
VMVASRSCSSVHNRLLSDLPDELLTLILSGNCVAASSCHHFPHACCARCVTLHCRTEDLSC